MKISENYINWLNTNIETAGDWETGKKECIAKNQGFLAALSLVGAIDPIKYIKLYRKAETLKPFVISDFRS